MLNASWIHAVVCRTFVRQPGWGTPHGPRAGMALLVALVVSGAARVADAQTTTYGHMPLETPAAAAYGWSQAGEGQPAERFVSRIPALDRYLKAPHLRFGDPDDPGRHVGLGQPLVGTSWRNRPYHVGWLFGGLFGDELIRERLEQDGDLFGGYRAGWDFDHYWGTEIRFGFANLDLTDLQVADNPRRTSRDHFWDVHLMYYPWGDSRWRPFLTAGLGISNFYFRDDRLHSRNEHLLSVPVGGGLKYYVHNWMAWRWSVTDHISIAAHDLETMHNLSFTTGVEIRFGGRRTRYTY